MIDLVALRAAAKAARTMGATMPMSNYSAAIIELIDAYERLDEVPTLIEALGERLRAAEADVVELKEAAFGAQRGWTEEMARAEALETALDSKYQHIVPEHLNHMTDGSWHDSCGYCIHRRRFSGTGITALDEANKRAEMAETEEQQWRTEAGLQAQRAEAAEANAARLSEHYGGIIAKAGTPTEVAQAILAEHEPEMSAYKGREKLDDDLCRICAMASMIVAAEARAAELEAAIHSGRTLRASRD